MFYLVPILIIALALFWSGWHYYKDKHQPEPIFHLLGALLLGVLSSQLAGQLHNFSDWLGFSFKIEKSVGFLMYSIFQIGFVEELSKFLPFILICTRFKEYNEAVDGLIYASMIGIGFSIEETFFYSGFEKDNTLLLIRAATSPITHALFASFFGFFHILSLAKRNKLWLMLGFFLSVIFHGIYDYFSLLETHPYPLLAAGVILVIWILRIRTFKYLNSKND